MVKVVNESGRADGHQSTRKRRPAWQSEAVNRSAKMDRLEGPHYSRFAKWVYISRASLFRARSKILPCSYRFPSCLLQYALSLHQPQPQTSVADLRFAPLIAENYQNDPLFLMKFSLMNVAYALSSFDSFPKLHFKKLLKKTSLSSNPLFQVSSSPQSVIGFTMGSKQSSDHVQASVQGGNTAENSSLPPQTPWLERFLMKIGFFEYKYNAMYEPPIHFSFAFWSTYVSFSRIMACVALTPFLFEFLICRRYCGAEDCLFYRKTASRCIHILIILYFVRLRYLAWYRDTQQTNRNTSTTSSQSVTAIQQWGEIFIGMNPGERSSWSRLISFFLFFILFAIDSLALHCYIIVCTFSHLQSKYWSMS